MKAITILQPWASLIACGAKRIETRSWATKYRGPIAIHAGKALPSNDRQIIADTLYEKQLFHLPLGAVIASADFVDCVRIDVINAEKIEAATAARLANFQWIFGREFAFGDYTPGRYAWILDNVRRIDPIPAKGQQGLWNWDRGGPGE